MTEGRLPWDFAQARREILEKAVDDAIENVPDSAKAELASLSGKTKEDLRLQLLQQVEGESDREIWAAVLAMRSSMNSGVGGDPSMYLKYPSRATGWKWSAQ